MTLTHTVSTRQASDLLGVHESSIKRWCSSGELPCDYTPGGHRRILLGDLFPFAEERKLSYSLGAFGTDAETVWAGAQALQKSDDFAPLVDLLYGWLQEARGEQAGHLVPFLRRQGTPLPTLLDELLAPTMHRIGTDYHAGVLSIGDEHRMTHLIRDLLVGLHFEVQPSPADAVRRVAVVGCARGEVHELGALMVRALLEASGWRVIYLGLNGPTEEFPRQQRQHEATLVCISMIPPTGTPEATVMAEVLAHLYDDEHPYRLVFGGRAVSASIGERVDTPHLDVQAFDRMTRFADWLARLDG